MDIDVKEVIEYMKKWDKKVISLNNGWNIKQIDDYREFEVFNDAENQIHQTANEEELKEIIATIKA